MVEDFNGNIDSEKIKNETSNTVNQVRDSIRNTNIRADGLETKNFVKGMFTNPIEKIKEVLDDITGKTLKFAIIILAVWLVTILIKRLIGGVFNISTDNAILSLFKSLVAPVLSIVVTSGAILLLNKGNRKSLTTIITAITIANVPEVIATIVSLLNYASIEMVKLTSPIGTFCSVITIVLTFCTIKYMSENDDGKAIKTFAIVEGAYLLVAFILTFMGIYI